VVAALNPIAGEAMARQLEEQIAGMQAELAVAHTQIHRSEDRLRGTVQHLSRLESDARAAFSSPADAQLTTRSWDAAATAPPVPAPAVPEAAPQRHRLPAGGRRRGRGAGLESSLELPEQLKDHWFPAEFSASLTPGKMVPFELFGQTWVLFRDERGGAACVRDECAHRACPLSLGSVVDGRIRCAYHGWEFEGDGACTKMPSTAFCRVGTRSRRWRATRLHETARCSAHVLPC
jgi:chlorophyllide a oxygenase